MWVEILRKYILNTWNYHVSHFKEKRNYCIKENTYKHYLKRNIN